MWRAVVALFALLTIGLAPASRDPDQVLLVLTRNSATFTVRDLERTSPNISPMQPIGMP